MLQGETKFLEKLYRRYVQRNASPQQRDLIDLMIRTIRADIALCEMYVYSDDEPLRCAVSVFGGLHDVSVLYQDLRAWKLYSRGSFTIRMFPGDHFFVHTARPLLLQAITDDLKPQLSGIAAAPRS